MQKKINNFCQKGRSHGLDILQNKKYPFKTIHNILEGFETAQANQNSTILKSVKIINKYRSANNSIDRNNESMNANKQSFYYQHKTQLKNSREKNPKFNNSLLMNSYYYNKILGSPDKLKKQLQGDLDTKIGKNIDFRFKNSSKTNLFKNCKTDTKLSSINNSKSSSLHRNIKRTRKQKQKYSNKYIDISKYLSIYEGSRARVYQYFCFYEILLKQCKKSRQKFIEIFESIMHLQNVPITAQEILQILDTFPQENFTFQVFLKLVKDLELIQFQKNLNHYLYMIFKKSNLPHVSYSDLSNVLNERMAFWQAQSYSKQIFDKLQKTTISNLTIYELQKLCNQDSITCKLFYMLFLQEGHEKQQTVKLRF